MRAGAAAGHGETMKPTQALHEAGQSPWLDNITRGLLDEGICRAMWPSTRSPGLTSNPTIFDRAIRDGTAYGTAADADIAARKASGATDEPVFFDLALADLRRAADLFAPSTPAPTMWTAGYRQRYPRRCWRTTPPRTVDQAESLPREAALGNLLIKIPSTAEGPPRSRSASTPECR